MPTSSMKVMIDIDATATVIATTFDTSDGDIDVASGNTLYLDSTTTTIGASTNLTGLGTIDLLGNQTVNFASAYTISDTSTLLDPTGTITFDGPGTLTIASGGLFKMTADTASVAIDNQGNLDIESGTSTIDNSINTFTHSGVLTIRGTSSGDAELSVANGFTSAGTITLDNAHSTGRNQTLTVNSGTLLNSGVIETANTGGGGGTITLNAAILSNTGTINVNESMNLTFATSATNESSGNIYIADTKTLDIDGGTFNNNGTITLLGNSSSTTLDLAGLTSLNNNSGASITGSGTVVNSGVITGLGTFSVISRCFPRYFDI